MTEQSYLQIDGSGNITSYCGPEATEAFRAITIAHALRLYAKTGMKVNRAYTPKRMMQVAASMTGRSYKARDYVGAADDLQSWANAIKASLPVVGPASLG
jgi:hypothetical protein